jgi:hypothetical protein
MTPLPPEEVAKAIAALADDKTITAVKITTAEGSFELPVSEVWESRGTLHFSVLKSQPA